MRTELYRVLRELDKTKLSEHDKLDLITLFNTTGNSLIRDHIGFVLSDIRFEPLIPLLIDKIFDPTNKNNNSSMVLALREYSLQDHFLHFVKIMVTQDYEPRHIAFEAIAKALSSSQVSLQQVSLAKQLLYAEKSRLLEAGADSGRHSTLHFIDETIELLIAYNPVE